MSYLEQHRGVLRELFQVLGKDADWSDDPEVFVSHTLPRWLGRGHGNVGGKESFTDDQVAAARPLMSRLGLTQRVDPPEPQYDEVVVLGAAAIGLHRRLELVRTSGVRATVLTVLAGMRPHFGAERNGVDGDISELLGSDGRFAATQGWRAPPDLCYWADLLKVAGVDDYVAAKVIVPSETAIAKLLLPKHWPMLALSKVELASSPHDRENDLGQREVHWYEWLGPPHLPSVRLLNGRPVHRPSSHGGPDRESLPTTASTIEEWRETLPRGGGPRSVLFVVNQPHLGRVGLELHELLGSQSNPSIDFDVAGCETLTDVDFHLLLGELPARIALEATEGRTS